MTSRLTWPLIGLAIGMAFLWFALRGVDLESAWGELRVASPGWCAAVLLCGLAFIAAKTWRWSVILRPFLHIDFGSLQSAVYIGSAANLAIAHTGEFLRATLVGRRKGVAASAILASIALERAFDFIAVLGLLGLVLLTDARMPPRLVPAGILCLAIATLSLMAAVAVLRPTTMTRHIANALLSALPAGPQAWFREQAQRSIAGLASLKEPRRILAVFALSLLQWAVTVAAIWMSAAAVGSSIPITGAVAVLVLSVIGLTLPSSPAQLGTTQLAFVVGLGAAASQDEAAFAASLVYTSFLIVPVMLIGGILLLTAKWDRESTEA